MIFEKDCHFFLQVTPCVNTKAEDGTHTLRVSNTGNNGNAITHLMKHTENISFSTSSAHTSQTGVGARKNDLAFLNEATGCDRQETTDPTVDIDAGHHRSTKPPPHGNETIDHGNLSIKSDKNSES